MRYETLLAAASDKALLSKINKICPEAVFLHAGQADILNKIEGNKVVDCMKKLIQSLLASNTSTKLCISLIVPLSKNVPQVQSIIRQVNREIADWVSELRKNGESRIFTQNNDALRGFIHKSTGKYGVTVSLNERGQRKLWLSLKDALNRTLHDIPKFSSSGRGGKPTTRSTSDPNTRPQRNQNDHD